MCVLSFGKGSIEADIDNIQATNLPSYVQAP